MTTTLLDSPATDVRLSPGSAFIEIAGDLNAHRDVEYRLSLTAQELDWLRAHGFSARLIADRLLGGISIDAQQVLHRLTVTCQARAIVHSNLYSNLGMMNRSSYRQALGFIGNDPVRVVKGTHRINTFFAVAQRDITRAGVLESDAGLSAVRAEDLGYLRSSVDALVQAVSGREHRKDSAMLYLALPSSFVDQFGTLAEGLGVITRRRIARWLLAEVVAQELSWGAGDVLPAHHTLFTHQRAGAALSLPLVHGYAALDTRMRAHASNAVAQKASIRA